PAEYRHYPVTAIATAPHSHLPGGTASLAASGAGASSFAGGWLAAGSRRGFRDLAVSSDRHGMDLSRSKLDFSDSARRSLCYQANCLARGPFLYCLGLAHARDARS